MKFWELISAFGRGDSKIERLFRSDAWRVPFHDYYTDFDKHVVSQNRDVLDQFVPLDLSRACAELRSDLVFFTDASCSIVRSQRLDSSDVEISALQIHEQYGGAVIEDVLEKGSYRVGATIN